jgi:hypothetical protein
MAKTKTDTPAVTAGAPRLCYTLVGTVVTVVAHTGESNSEYTDEQIIKSISYDANDFDVFSTGTEGVTKTLMGYGLQKLLQDRTSQLVGGPLVKINGMEKEAARLHETKQWSERKESAERTPRAKVCNLLAQAVALVQGIPVAQAEASLKALDKDIRARVAANPRVVATLETLKAEAKDAAAVDLGDLLG